MHVRKYSSEGIILARRNYKEADRIISIFSRDYGRISLLAKGIRRPKSRKRGHLEIFSRIKFSGTSAKGLPLLLEAESIDNYEAVRKNLKKTALAYYLVEVIGRTTHEEESHKELYYLIADYFEDLKTEQKLRSLKNRFIAEVLTSLGFWPKGLALVRPEDKLEEITERVLGSARVGKKLVI